MKKKKNNVPLFMRNQYYGASGGGSFDGARLPKDSEHTMSESVPRYQYCKRKDGSTVVSYLGRSEKY